MAIVKKKLKSGEVVYQVLVQDNNGAWFSRKQFRTKNDAEIYEASLITLKSKGGFAKNSQTREMTLSQYYDEVWKIEGRPKVGLGWRSSQDQMFRDHVAPTLGRFSIVEITKQDIAKLFAHLQDVKNLGAQVRIHIYNILNSIFRYSIEISELRDSNPILSRFKPAPAKHVPTYFSPDAARDFLEVVADHWLGPAIWIMMVSGLRVCEVIALQYGDMDLVTLKISLRRQWRRSEKRIALVKNKGAEKSIAIAFELGEYLKGKMSPVAKPTDWVIQSPWTPGQMVSYQALYNALKRLCKTHKFPWVSPHGLRHTTSGLWNEIGAKVGDLKDLYNHKDDSTTERYNHGVTDRLNELGRKVILRKKRDHLTLVKKQS